MFTVYTPKTYPQPFEQWATRGIMNRFMCSLLSQKVSPYGEAPYR